MYPAQGVRADVEGVPKLTDGPVVGQQPRSTGDRRWLLAGLLRTAALRVPPLGHLVRERDGLRKEVGRLRRDLAGLQQARDLMQGERDRAVKGRDEAVAELDGIWREMGWRP